MWPIDDVDFVAVGGVQPENIADFFAAGGIVPENGTPLCYVPERGTPLCYAIAVGDSIAPKKYVEKGDWGAITEIAQKYVQSLPA